MEQAMEEQVHKESSKQAAPFSLKAWLLEKLIQYIDNTFQTLFTGFVLGGALWVVQHLWGLRLLPFNILDTILLVVMTAIVLLGFISLVFWLGLKWLIEKHPGFFVLLGFMALLPYLLDKHPGFFRVPENWKWAPGKTAATASDEASLRK